jgi:hypothetical protein
LDDGPGGPGGSYGFRPRRAGPNRLTVLLVVVLLLVGGALWLAGHLPGLNSPFAERRVDRSPPALLKAMEDLSVYKAATGNFQTIVDLEKDTPYVPSAIKGERTLFMAVGNVDAQVDFSKLGKDAVKVSQDGTSVTVTLPAPTLGKPYLDISRSRVVSRERGVLDRIGSALGDNPDDNQELYQVAEQKLAAAAQETDLVGRAETNTRAMLTGLIRSLGYEKVTVNFVDQPVER